MGRRFEELVAEAERAPIRGWDFGWLDGRAVEERPTWHYFDVVADAAATASSMLKLEVGDGRLIAALPSVPKRTVGTEGYPPNVAIAGPRLRARGAQLIWTDDARPLLPLTGGSFELVISRHPIDTWWSEIARVLQRGGRYLSQQVGPYSLRELSELLMGPLPPGSRRDPEDARRSAEHAGLVVTDLRQERPAVEFYDIGAVVYFLRLVVWIVPGFTAARFEDQLRRLHEHIETTGSFRTTASRFLIEAVKQ